MTTPFETKFRIGRGYWPNQSLVGEAGIEESLIDGKNMWVEGPDRLRSWGGATSFATLIQSPGTLGLVGRKIYAMANGSAALYKGGAIFFMGNSAADVFVGNSSGFTKIGATDSVSTTAGPTGNLYVSLDGSANSAFRAGLTAPTLDGFLPTLLTSNTTDAYIEPGTYSCKFTYFRTTTGTESSASPASNTFASDGTKKILVLLPQTVPPNCKIRIYFSKRGFPQGPWFLLPINGATEIELPSSPFTVEVDFNDGDLLNINAPFDHDLPPTGTHCIALSNVIVVLGVGAVGGVQFSKPNKPEAFPIQFLTYLNPNEPVLGVRGRPADGWQYVFCRNSLHAVYYTGDDLFPIGTRPIWNSQGIANEDAAAFVGGEFYAFSAKKGALRTTAGNQTAEPDSTFALPVESLMETWTPADVVVGYSQDTDSVAYFHQNVCLMYMRKLDCWSLPFVLADAGITGSVTACTEFEGKLVFNVGGQLYEMSGASATIPWEATHTWKTGGSEAYYKTLTGMRGAFNFGSDTSNKYRLDLLVNFNMGSVKEMIEVAGTSTAINTLPSGTNLKVAEYTDWKKTNIKGAVIFTLRHKGTGANKYVFSALVTGGVTKMRT